MIDFAKDFALNDTTLPNELSLDNMYAGPDAGVETTGTPEVKNSMTTREYGSRLDVTIPRFEEAII